MAHGAREKIVEALRTRIALGEIRPGTLVPETALAQEFNSSRTPVREALKQLESEGLVEIRPRVGTFVIAPKRLEVNELLEVREILESACARLFARRGNVPELARLRENVAAAAQALKRGRLAECVTLSHEFHDIVVLGAGNSKLVALNRILMNQLLHGQFLHQNDGNSDHLRHIVKDHAAILECIEAKDSAGAERLMREHVRIAHQALMEKLVFEGSERRLSVRSGV